MLETRKSTIERYEQVRQKCLGKLSFELISEIDQNIKENDYKNKKTCKLVDEKVKQSNYVVAVTGVCLTSFIATKMLTDNAFLETLTLCGVLGCLAGNVYVLSSIMALKKDLNRSLQDTEENLIKLEVADEFLQYEKEYLNNFEYLQDFSCRDYVLQRANGKPKEQFIENEKVC